MIKVRFAPSPTGIPHIGNTRTAFLNYLFAKANKGEFILRIEDTDQKRIVKGAEDAILEILEWLGIKNDGEIMHQSKRVEIYKKYVEELLSKKIAYEKEGAVFLKMPNEKTFEWNDLVGNKKIKFQGKDQEDFVILKSDGFPTYHLANVIDDHLMQISHVIRGEEWISSTPKHLYLYEIFGWNAPYFGHLPVILGPDKAKLSKRHGAESILDYREKGYLKEALLNYMALLGWNPGADERSDGARLLDKRGREQEIFSIDELIKLFDIKDVNTANPIFDVKKLEWLNGVWIRSLSEAEFKKRIKDFYSNDSSVLDFLNKNKIMEGAIFGAAKTRMRTLSDFKKLILEEESTRKKTKEEKEISEKLFQYLSKKLGNDWKDESLLLEIKNFSKENSMPFKAIFFLMTGKEHGIGILELNGIYGKDFFINNLKK